MEVADGSNIAGHKLRYTNIRSETRRGDRRDPAPRWRNDFNPSADTRIEAGDMLIAIGRSESLMQLTALARGAARSGRSVGQ